MLYLGITNAPETDSEVFARYARTYDCASYDRLRCRSRAPTTALRRVSLRLETRRTRSARATCSSKSPSARPVRSPLNTHTSAYVSLSHTHARSVRNSSSERWTDALLSLSVLERRRLASDRRSRKLLARSTPARLALKSRVCDVPTPPDAATDEQQQQHAVARRSPLFVRRSFLFSVALLAQERSDLLGRAAAPAITDTVTCSCERPHRQTDRQTG